MKRASLVIFIGCLLTASCSLATGQEGRYLEGASYGPYRGQVVDAETKQPLEGAVVVAVWSQKKIYPGHSSTVHYATREAVTDKDGRFVIDAKALEENAPRRTLHPYFVVFYPGYAAYGSFPFVDRVSIQGDFRGSGATIRLPRLRIQKERLRLITSVSPYSLSEDPFKEIPLLIRAWNIEGVSLGLEPYSAPEKTR